MNVENSSNIPIYQDDFFKSIVVPAFELLQGLLPETKDLLECVNENHLKWKLLAASEQEYSIKEMKTSLSKSRLTL